MLSASSAASRIASASKTPPSSFCAWRDGPGGSAPAPCSMVIRRRTRCFWPFNSISGGSRWSGRCAGNSSLNAGLGEDPNELLERARARLALRGRDVRLDRGDREAQLVSRPRGGSVGRHAPTRAGGPRRAGRGVSELGAQRSAPRSPRLRPLASRLRLEQHARGSARRGYPGGVCARRPCRALSWYIARSASARTAASPSVCGSISAAPTLAERWSFVPLSSAMLVS